MTKRLHFWLRIEGDIGREHFESLPYAQLDNGKIVKYHFAAPDPHRVEAEFFACSVFHWTYLGKGRIFAVEGVVPACTDGRIPAKEAR